MFESAFLLFGLPFLFCSSLQGKQYQLVSIAEKMMVVVAVLSGSSVCDKHKAEANAAKSCSISDGHSAMGI